jgi:hypothetical protein
MTAVEWLADRLPKIDFEDDPYYRELLIEAKEMERQQIVMAFWNSKHSLCDENTDLLYLAEQYYNAKFKQS